MVIWLRSVEDLIQFEPTTVEEADDVLRTIWVEAAHLRQTYEMREKYDLAFNTADLRQAVERLDERYLELETKEWS